MIDIAALVREHFQDAEVEASGDGSAGTRVRVVSDRFTGLTKVKRSQLVYRALSKSIRDGRLHSVSVEALTPEEAHERQVPPNGQA